MLLLGLVAAGFIPFMVNTMRSVSRDTTIATATQIVNERLYLVKNAANKDCASFQTAVDQVHAAQNTFMDGSGSALIDGRGIPLTATITVSDVAGTELTYPFAGTFDCNAGFVQVSMRVTGPLTGNTGGDYMYAKATSFVRIAGTTVGGGS